MYGIEPPSTFWVLFFTSCYSAVRKQHAAMHTHHGTQIPFAFGMELNNEVEHGSYWSTDCKVCTPQIHDFDQ